VGAAQSRQNAARRAEIFLCPETSKNKLLVPCCCSSAFVVWVMVPLGHATEARAYGVLGALVIAWWSGGLDRAASPRA
jgi:hypothetical protein